MTAVTNVTVRSMIVRGTKGGLLLLAVKFLGVVINLVFQFELSFLLQ